MLKMSAMLEQSKTLRVYIDCVQGVDSAEQEPAKH